MNEKDPPKKGHSIDSSYFTVGNNSHQQKNLLRNQTHIQLEEPVDNSDNVLSTHSLFDVNQQRKTSISFDKIKQLTLALSLPSSDDLDIAQVDPQISSINDHKIDYSTYNEFVSSNCQCTNEQLADSTNYKVLSSSSSAEEATSEYVHQNELFQSVSQNYSSSSLLNTPIRERQSTSFTKLDHSTAKKSIIPDNEQDSGLESEFGPNESIAQNVKFNSDPKYNNVGLSHSIDTNVNRISPKGSGELCGYKNRDYNHLKRDMYNIYDNKDQLNFLRRPNIQYIEESHIIPNNKSYRMTSSVPSLTKNTNDKFSHNLARTSRLDGPNLEQTSERYLRMNPDVNKSRLPFDTEMSNCDERYNPFEAKLASDNTYSFNMSTRSPQRIRHRYIIRDNGLIEDNDSDLGIKLTQTQNNQKVTVTMISHNNFVNQDNKLMEEQLFDIHQNQIDTMIGTPEHKVRDMNIDSKKILRNQGEHESYKTDRLNYGYPTNHQKVFNQDDDYEKNQRQSPQVEWSNVPRALSHSSSNYEGSSASRTRSRSPQSECSSNRIQRRIINPNIGFSQQDEVDDRNTNNYTYPQMINVGESCFYGHNAHASPTKFSTRPNESVKSDSITPPTNSPYKYNPYKTDEQDRTLVSDDYSTIATNNSANNRHKKSMQATTKISSPISNRMHSQKGTKNDQFTEQSMNNSMIPMRRLSSCGDVLQIEVGGSDVRSDNDGGIEIIIGNVMNQLSTRAKSRNPFLTSDYSTSPTGAMDTLNSTQNLSYYSEGRQQNGSHSANSSEYNQHQQQAPRRGIDDLSNSELRSMKKRQNELSIEHITQSCDLTRLNLPDNHHEEQKQTPITVCDDGDQSQVHRQINFESQNSNSNRTNSMICEHLKHEAFATDHTKDYREEERVMKDISLTLRDNSNCTTSTITKKEIPQTNMYQAKIECPLNSNSETIQMKPIKIRNLINGNQTVDTLHQTSNKPVGCTYLHCMGSIINPEPVRHSVRSPEEILEQANQFLNQYYTSIKRLNSPAHKARIEEIKEQIKLTKTYYLKETELIFGAKLAWRNAPRCIGRIQWSKLQVFDARFTTTTHEMFEALCNHIRYATNKGSLRSAITIFPQRIKSTKYDYRVWNSQLIGYAGYRSKVGETVKIVGDPANADFTEMCQKLGWQGSGTRFDILPLVLSANGGQPQFFPLPEELVLRIKLHHPKYDWFKELGLEWYALPAVSSMMLDVGGLQFPAAPFSGWYMVTEIGTRDLGDASRYNILETVAQGMGLDTTSNVSLWRDQALVEVNLAVLDSYQRAGVTIVDHHTASETFMTHLANEQRLRGGCPADWVWIVPPTGGSTMQVYHQEMVNYHLLPNYEYLEPAWKTFDWSQVGVNGQQSHQGDNGSHMGTSPLTPSRLLGGLTPRKLRFKEIARAVKFTSKLFGKALSRRIKATILYATETGKSERYANKLAQIFSHAFNVHLMCMNDYDMTCLEHEALLLIVTSTFGNGDPPENGETFARQLHAIKLTGDTTPDMESVSFVSTTTFTRVLSSSQSVEDPLQQSVCPLSNVRFAVFSLGSTAYPNFCAFGRYVDQTLGELGAERILKCECGDELCGQEKAFAEWSKMVFRTACEVFCISDNFVTINERTSKWNPKDVKFIPVNIKKGTMLDYNNNSNIQQDLINMTNKKITPFNLRRRQDLHMYDGRGPLQTICVELETSDGLALQFEPGDHVAIYPTNNVELVQGIIEHMKRHDEQMDPNIIYKILVKREDLDITPASVNAANQSAAQSASPTTIVRQSRIESGTNPFSSPTIAPMNDNGYCATNQNVTPSTSRASSSNMNVDIGPLADLSIIDTSDDQDDANHQLSNMMANTNDGVGGSKAGNDTDEWILHDRLPITSIREALTRFLDITTPPSQEYLSILGQFADDVNEKKRLQQLATNSAIYEEWKHANCSNLLHVLDQFKSIGFKPTLLTQLPLIQPRFYSISSSPTISESKISLTVGIIRWKTKTGHKREGVCSNYLNRVDKSETIYGYIRSAPSFHMPQDTSLPMILIGPGTGIAPFRSFWQYRYSKWNISNKSDLGTIDLYFGCRNHDARLYKDELDDMVNKNIITYLNVAYSRLTTSPKQYVQDKLRDDSERVRELILKQGAHVYVCGDVAMAEGVHKQLQNILSDELGSNNRSQSDELLISLREQNRYHEDIFGAKPSS